jgi:hypothetical protein
LAAWLPLDRTFREDEAEPKKRTTIMNTKKTTDAQDVFGSTHDSAELSVEQLGNVHGGITFEYGRLSVQYTVQKPDGTAL